MAALILPLSFSAGAIATPAIGRDLGGSALALNWITNAFMLTFGSSLMAAGSLADRFGRKRLFAIGVALFAAASAMLWLAPGIVWVDLLRAVQGFGAAAGLAGGTAALAQEFDGEARLRAFSLLGTTFGIGLALGPVLAGVLIGQYGWRSVFLSGAAIGSLTLLFGVPRMRESRDPDASDFDRGGAVTFTCALGLFTWGILQGPVSGWTSWRVMALIAGAALCLVAFIVAECGARRPMLDLSLFRYPRFIGVQLLPIATCYGFVVLLVLLPLRFVGIEGRTEVSAGLAMIALSGPMLIMPSLAAWLTRWVSAGAISGIGLLVAAVGLLWLSRVGLAEPASHVLGPMLVIGIGTGLPWGLMDGLAISVVPKARAGMATGIFSTMRVAGEGIALAIVTALLTTLIQTRLATDNGASLAATAQRLAAGDMHRALQLAAGVEPQRLAKAYDDAFRWLVYILISVTLTSAGAVFWLLGKGDSRVDQGSSPRARAQRESR